MSDGFDLSLVFDALVAVLLVATIVYAAILNRKLSKLRDLKSEMEMLATRLAESTEMAENGLQSLRGEVERSGDTMQRSAETARGIADELGFLIERGEALTRRLDGALATARGPAKPASHAETAMPAMTPSNGPSAVRAGPEPAPNPRAIRTTAMDSEPMPSPQEAALLKVLQGLR